MYICPVCNRSFKTEDIIVKHYLKCWREEHPYHMSKEAPRSEDKVVKIVNDDIINFFNGLQEGR